MAVIATSYLAITLTAPQLVGLPDQVTTSRGRYAANGQVSNKFVRHLQERLSNAQFEIARLRTQLSQQQEALNAQQQTTQQAANSSPSAQNQPPMAGPVTTTAILKTAMATAVTTDQANETSIPNKTPTNLDSRTQSALELKLAKAQIENEKNAPKSKQQSSPIETGSIKIPPPPMRAPPRPIKSMRIVGSPRILPNKTPTRTPAKKQHTQTQDKQAQLTVATRSKEPRMGVRLATGPSIDALRLRWNMMLDRAGATLSTLQPRFVLSKKPGVLGPNFDLIAGPLNTLSDAQRICNAAAVSNSICEIRKLDENSKTL